MLKVRGDSNSRRLKQDRKIVMILDRTDRKDREVVNRIFRTCLDEDLGQDLTKETLENHKTEIQRLKKSKCLFLYSCQFLTEFD